MSCCNLGQDVLIFSNIRPLEVRPLTNPEREPKPWGFFVFRVKS